MSRAWTLTLFFARDLFLSLAGILPLAAALAFGLIAFEYGMDQPQFVTVAGAGIGAIGLMTTLLLASRANRATSYPLVARLYRRAELLTALVLGSLAITAALALFITAGNVAAGRLSLDFPSVLWILPTWLALWLMMSSLALILSGLAGREGSNLLGYLLIAGLLVINDRKALLVAGRLGWLAQVATIVLWPINTMLSRASAGLHDRTYFLALALTLVYALLLFSLATQLFEGKDLLWAE
jgi:hypothetical protein